MSDFIDRPGPHYPSNIMIWFMWSQSAEFVVPLRDQYNDAFGHLWFLIHSSNATFQVNSSACVLFSLAPKAFGTWLNVTTAWGVSNGLFKFPKAFWKTPKLFSAFSQRNFALFCWVCESDILLQYNHISSLPLLKDIKYHLGTNTGFVWIICMLFAWRLTPI